MGDNQSSVAAQNMSDVTALKHIAEIIATDFRAKSLMRNFIETHNVYVQMGKKLILYLNVTNR